MFSFIMFPAFPHRQISGFTDFLFLRMTDCGYVQTRRVEKIRWYAPQRVVHAYLTEMTLIGLHLGVQRILRAQHGFSHPWGQVSIM